MDPNSQGGGAASDNSSSNLPKPTDNGPPSSSDVSSEHLLSNLSAAAASLGGDLIQPAATVITPTQAPTTPADSLIDTSPPATMPETPSMTPDSPSFNEPSSIDAPQSIDTPAPSDEAAPTSADSTPAPEPESAEPSSEPESPAPAIEVSSASTDEPIVTTVEPKKISVLDAPADETTGAAEGRLSSHQPIVWSMDSATPPTVHDSLSTTSVEPELPADNQPSNDSHVVPVTDSQPASPEVEAAVIAPVAAAAFAPVDSGGEVSTPEPQPMVVSSDGATPVAGQAGAQSTAPAAITTDSHGMPLVIKKRRSLKPALIAIAAVFLLGGSSAAAYYGVVVPNQPENVLKTAVANSLSQPQITAQVSAEGTTSGAAYKTSFTASADTTKKAAVIQLNVTVTGANLTFEARMIDQNIYLKVGDLTTISNLIAGYSPSLAPVVKTLNTELSNQWIVFDSTILKQANASCALNLSWSLSKADMQLLQSQYGQHSFVTVKSTSADTVHGQKATKMVLSIDDDKAAAFGGSKQLANLSFVQALNKCDPSQAGSSTVSKALTGDHKQTALTVWVDKANKRIVQISLPTSSTGSSTVVDGSGTIGLSYDKVTIAAPSGAKPAIQVLADLQTKLNIPGLDLTGLFGGTSANGSLPANADDSLRKADIASLQTNVEAFFSQNGYYPSLTQLNSASWRKTNMPGLDSAALNDPNGSSATLAAKPAAKVYSYQPTTTAGASCEAKATDCANYTLTATLSTGSSYVRTALD